MITNAVDLVAWIEASLPDLDPDRFEPWVVEPPVPGALRAVIEIRIHAPAVAAQVIRIEVSAAPTSATDS
ncbi:hypothetical protein [Nocardia amamiensis]|uniref:hypothetical protein n=1 Tax=Nocardia amamiensis TaxID=404578 RepID=UPI000B2CD260|nr:hypothetical protein [Nocardia amamiensis]